MTERKSQNDVGSSGSGSKRGESIDARGETLLSESMPVDIMFEVAGYVTLRDLVALSHTSEALRGTLHSHIFFAIWKAALRAAGAPDCPSDFSEPQWAVFLYGPSVCERCGATNTHRVEIRIRRRVCAHCKRKYLINTVRFPDLFPHCDAAVLDMIPYTWDGGRMPSRHYEGKFFWKPDIERISAEWAILQGNIQAHVEGAEEKAAAYQAQRILAVKHIVEYADEFEDEVRGVGTQSRAKVIDMYIPRFNAIRTRLLTLGYDSQDINYTAFYPPEFQQGAELTDESWEHIRPQAVAVVESRRDARLEGHRALRRIARIRMLQALYLEHVKSANPQKWCYLPSIYELAEFPVFKGIVEVENIITVSPSTFLSAAELSIETSKWLSAKKARVTAMLGSRSGTVDDPLDLATSVFECTSHACSGVLTRYERHILRSESNVPSMLISWEAIAAHSCPPAGRYKSILPFAPTSVGVSHLGGIAAAVLVQEAGLEPTLATIAQMDALDLRFACLECSPVNGRRRVGYPWKYAVAHGMSTQHATWYKMSSEEAERARQMDWDRSWRGSWSCSHCTKYFNLGDLKSDVLEHVKAEHGILDPAEPGDLFRYPREYYPSFILGSIEITEPAPPDVVDA